MDFIYLFISVLDFSIAWLLFLNWEDYPSARRSAHSTGPFTLCPYGAVPALC